MAARLGLIGLGLIGGSLAWAARRSGAYSVVGYDKSPGVAREAVRLGAIDTAAETLAEAAGQADLVVVATPPSTVAEVVLAAAGACRPGTTLTDVAGFKGRIIAEVAAGLPSGMTFVGGHPMAGSEKSGLGAADPDLFRGVPYVIIRGRAGVAAVERLARAIGARPVSMDAAEHDRMVAVVSHLPYLLAVSLCREAEASGAADLAAGAFRDATRVAAGPPEMGFGMCAGNAEECARAWEALRSRMDRLMASLGADSPGPPADATEAAAFRRRWPGEAQGHSEGQGGGEG